MTKEELEQKAINRIKETTPVLKDRSDIEIIAICHVRVEDYIAGATEATKELEAQIEKMKSDVKGNIKWADENKNNQMYFKLNAMFNKWEIKENDRRNKTTK